MNSAWFDNLVAWIGAHPVAAGGVIFLIAFCDALALIGIVVPALPLLFAVGTMIGLGHLSGPYAVICAALGALAGDALSFWVGWRWGPQLREHWLFRRYPQLIDRGEALFRKHGVKSILIARYVGAVRPFVPAVAGMLRMPLKRYAPISAFAALTWSASFLAPGWIFGASYDAVAAVADRLALVLLALLVVVGLAWASVLYTWRWFADHADRLLSRAIAWTHAHPHLGRYAQAVFDPSRRESTSLAILALCLLVISWGWFWLLGAVVTDGEPLALDLAMQRIMFGLRNPLADRLFAALSALGDAQVLLPPVVAVLGYLIWRRRWLAAAHWLAALAFGMALTAFLDTLIDVPRPALAPPGFGFPAMSITMITIAFGFFAVLIAREWPGRRRVWPYLVGGAVAAAVGFAKLYFGAHWLSDVVGGMLFGAAWLLLLGIAYRRRVAGGFWMRPLAGLFYSVFVLAAFWHAPQSIPRVLVAFAPPVPTMVQTPTVWWRSGWRALPEQRQGLVASAHQQLDVQYAGSIATLQDRLQAAGWRRQEQADWLAVLALLNDQAGPQAHAVLPATLDARAESLLMRRDSADGRSTHVLRLWLAPIQLSDATALWIGQTQTLRMAHPVRGIGLWRPVDDQSASHAALMQALYGWPMQQSTRGTQSAALPVLRVRAPPQATPIGASHTVDAAGVSQG